MKYVRYADILNGINEQWSIKEKVKYVYSEICKLSTYDERIIYTNNPELIKLIYNKKVSIYEYITPKLICKTLNDIFSQLLDKLNIKYKLINKPSSITHDIQIDDIAY